MPSLLEEAILDAKLLREAALKTAENKIIEQYAEQVRSAMNTLLEQTEGDDPITMPEPAQTEEETVGGSDEVRIPESALGEKILKALKAETSEEPDEDDEEVVEVDMDALREALGLDEQLKEEAEELEEEINESPMETLKNIISAGVLATSLATAADMVVEQDPAAPVRHLLDAMYSVVKDMPPGAEINLLTFTQELGQDIKDAVVGEEDKEVEIKEDLEEEVLQEELVVDITDGDFTGWAGRPEHDRQRQQKINLARLADTKQKEEFAKLQQGMKDLAGISESLKKENTKLSEKNQTLLETIEALKERLEDTALLNAKLLYQNKVLTNESLNTRQKNSIVESIQKANTTSDAKVIYETLQSAASAGSVGSSRKESLHEAINRPSHTVTRRTTNNDSLLNEMTDRFQLLAGIKKH